MTHEQMDTLIPIYPSPPLTNEEEGGGVEGEGESCDEGLRKNLNNLHSVTLLTGEEMVGACGLSSPSSSLSVASFFRRAPTSVRRNLLRAEQKNKGIKNKQQKMQKTHTIEKG